MTDAEKLERRRRSGREYAARKRAEDPAAANARQTAYREAHPEHEKRARRRTYRKHRRKRLAESRAWQVANPDKVRDKELRWKYGITLAQREQMIADQGGLCACCGQVLDRARPRTIATDHNQDPWYLRGIICMMCNTGIGKLGDTIAGLRRALDYLERAEAGHERLRALHAKAAGILDVGGG